MEGALSNSTSASLAQLLLEKETFYISVFRGIFHTQTRMYSPLWQGHSEDRWVIKVQSVLEMSILEKTVTQCLLFTVTALYLLLSYYGDSTVFTTELLW